MLANRVTNAPANRRARAVSQHKNGDSMRKGKRLGRPGRSPVLSLSQQLDLADRADPAVETPPVTPRADRGKSPSFGIAVARYSSPGSGDDDDEAFRRMFTRQRVYTPSSARSRRTFDMRASSPEHVPSSPRAISRLPPRTGASDTREVGVSIELIASRTVPRAQHLLTDSQNRKYLDFDVAFANRRLAWGNIQSNVAALINDGEFGLDMFDDAVGKWRQFGLDGSVNVLRSQTVVLGRLVYAHALSLDDIEIPTTDENTSPVRINSNGKRPAFPPLKMGPRPGKKAKTG